jgi:hypothetical protein
MVHSTDKNVGTINVYAREYFNGVHIWFWYSLLGELEYSLTLSKIDGRIQTTVCSLFRPKIFNHHLTVQARMAFSF